MTWNYRLVRHEAADHGAKPDDPFFPYLSMHEVHYGPDGSITGITTQPVTVRGDDLEEVAAALARMRQALEKPVLRLADGSEVAA